MPREDRRPGRRRHPSFVDLTTPDDRLEPYASVVARAADDRRLDLLHLPFPIPDFGVIEDHRYDDLLAAVRAHGDRGAVYLHCWGGDGRTGTVIGCLLADEARSYDDVMRRMGALRAGTRKQDRPCPESETQRDVIRRRLAARGG